MSLKTLVFKNDKKNDKTKEANTTSEVKSQPIVSSSTNVQGVVDNKFVDMLEGIIEKNNVGKDYFDFKQAVEKMKTLALDEKSKFQTVHTVLGCKKDVLLTSIEKYISIINVERKNFDAEMKSQFISKVQSKLDLVEKDKKEMEDLSKKLSDLNTSILTLSQDAQAEEMKIRATEANFKTSAEMIINEMTSDKDKINNFITA